MEEMSNKTADNTGSWADYAVRQANEARKLEGAIERSVVETAVPDFTKINPQRVSELRGHGIRVFFGSDGFLQNPKVREEVRILRGLLRLKGIEELGFGLDTNEKKTGKAWALIARSEEDVQTLAKLVWAAHWAAFTRTASGATGCDLFRHWLEAAGLDADDALVQLRP